MLTLYLSHAAEIHSTTMKASAIAGSLAACAGMLGKLGADSDSGVLHAVASLCASSSIASTTGIPCDWVASLLRVAFIALMLVTNGLMLSFFVKGLHETDSLTATVTSAAVNFMLSAAGGWLFFHEGLPLQWFVGASIILSGVALLLYGDSAPTPPAPSTKPKQN